MKTPEKPCAVLFDPHPDDADWWAGGLTCMLVDKGWTVHYVCVGPTAEETRAYAKESADILAVSRHFWEIPINGNAMLRKDLFERVFPFLEEHRPRMVFAPAVTDYHQEHVDLSRELLRTFRDRGRHEVDPFEIYTYDSHENREPVEIYVDVTAVWERHMQSLGCHRNFERPGLPGNSLTRSKTGRAAVLGASVPVDNHRVLYAEGFRIIWGDPKEVSTLRILFPDQFFFRPAVWLTTM